MKLKAEIGMLQQKPEGTLKVAGNQQKLRQRHGADGRVQPARNQPCGHFELKLVASISETKLLCCSKPPHFLILIAALANLHKH